MLRLFFLILSGILVYESGSKLAQTQSLQQEETFPFLSLRPSLVQTLSLGHYRLYMDFAYLWALQKLIVEREQIQDPDLLYKQLKTVSVHHPQIQSFYTLSCFVLEYDHKRMELCEDLAKDGMEALPQNWLIPAIVGYMYAFRENNPWKGSYYLGLTKNKPNSPDYLHKLSERVLKGGLTQKESFDTLKSIVEGTEDPDLRNFLIRFLNERRE